MSELDYATDIRKARRKGSKGTQEFFTPSELVNKMCDKIPKEIWADPTKTFLEPSAGNGNFVVEIIRRRIVDYKIPWDQTLKTTFSLELMQDNVDEMKERIINLLKDIAPNFNKKEAMKILDKNCVCHDFFKWDFDNWQPIKEAKLDTLF